MKTMTVAMSVLALSAMMTGMLAETADAKKINASRDQVRQACKANGGFGWGLKRKKGMYGCNTNGGFIDCKENGDCKGNRHDATAARKATR